MSPRDLTDLPILKKELSNNNYSYEIPLIKKELKEKPRTHFFLLNKSEKKPEFTNETDELCNQFDNKLLTFIDISDIYNQLPTNGSKNMYDNLIMIAFLIARCGMKIETAYTKIFK